MLLWGLAHSQLGIKFDILSHAAKFIGILEFHADLAALINLDMVDKLNEYIPCQPFRFLWLVGSVLNGGMAGIGSRGLPYLPRDKVSRSGQRIKEKRPHSIKLHGRTKQHIQFCTYKFRIQGRNYPEGELRFF